MRVSFFDRVNLRTLATWQAVRGLSPVIMTTWKEGGVDGGVEGAGYLMRTFEDLLDHGLRVGLQRARDHDKSSKTEVLLEEVPRLVPDLTESNVSACLLTSDCLIPGISLIPRASTRDPCRVSFV